MVRTDRVEPYQVLLFMVCHMYDKWIISSEEKVLFALGSTVQNVCILARLMDDLTRTRVGVRIKRLQ